MTKINEYYNDKSSFNYIAYLEIKAKLFLNDLNLVH